MATAEVPSWNVTGTVIEARPLTGGKENKVFAYVAKVMAMGGTFEVQTRDPAYFALIGVGAEYKFRGIFESYQNALRLTATELYAIDGKKLYPAPVAPVKA